MRDRPRILVVDDNEANRYVLTRCLRQFGFGIEEASTGKDCLRLVRASSPALVLLDIHLPDLSGIDVCRELKRNARTSSIPVIQMSASLTEKGDRIDGLESGADAYLTAPYEPRELLAQVKSLLRIREKEQQLRLALDAAQLGTWTYTFESNRWELDPRAQDLYGLSSPIYVHDEPHLSAIIPEPDRAEMWQAIQRACDPNGPGRYEAEYRVRRPDGEHWIRAWGQVEFAHSAGQRGPVRMVGVSRDVTEGRVAEEARRQALAQYERQVRLFDGVASTTPDFVYLFDLQGRFRYANRRLLQVWGMELPAVIGKTCRELGYEQWHHDMHMREIAQVIQNKRPIKGEVPFKAPLTGVFGVYEYIFTPVLGPDGEVELIAGTTRDVTERKQAEEALARAQEQLREHARTLEVTVAERTATLRETVSDLEQFSYSMAHDLRAPLRSMNCFSTFLLEALGPKLDGEHLDFLRRIASAAQRMDELICDVLTYTKVARVELTPVPVDLNALVKDIIEQYPHLQPSQAQIHVRHPLLAVRGNVALVTQCVSNLLGNAVKFVAPGVKPAIEVWTEARQDRVRVCIKDNGIGISTEHLERIWRLFERAHDQKEYPGTGIGLSVVKRAAERMGGTVGVDSKPGAGSTFWFEVPKV